MKYLTRWLYIRYWQSEIIDAHAYIERKRLRTESASGLRREYPLREAGGAIDVLEILKLRFGAINERNGNGSND